ncbi:hypothetical protein [Microvirga sp. Mcv34]|uniref:hypothetical protein n=1 Tax=Microvirga sp. Mcv34 TaxID=2926016 RepID=UPI0021C7628D|nr:hypothetical protein [Microvirga sp. Mcv34]
MDPAKRKRQGSHIKKQAAIALNAKRRAERLAEATTPRTDAELIAEFVASGKVKKLPEGRADGAFSGTVFGAFAKKITDL